MSDKTWITGEFVETVQLQVVCQTLINKLAPNATEISMEHLEAYGSLDKALQMFYEDSVREVIEKTRDELHGKGESELTEGVLRTWFEKKLITPAQTRGLAYRGTTHTEGLPNEAVDVLDQAHIIREERRGSGRWYELSHDRFVDPILTSNKEWMVQYSGAAKVRQWLEERSARWNKTQDEAVLLSENELAEAERWVKSAEAAELGYDPAVINLIQSSRTNLKNKKRERELEIQSAQRLARSARRFKWASVGFAIMFLLGVVTTVIAWGQWKKAHDNLQLAHDSLEFAKSQEAAAEKARNEAVEWAHREYAAKEETAKKAKEAEQARSEAARRAEQAERARRDAERAKGQLRGALQKVEERAREAETARRTDRLSREAFRLSRRPESQQDAVEQFNHAIDVYRQTGDRDAQADSYLNQGQVYRDMGEEERAEDAFNKALQLYRATPVDPLKQASMLNNIGVIYTTTGSSDGQQDQEALQTAMTKFYSALTLYRAQKDSFGEASTLTNIGDAQLTMNFSDDRRRALQFYEQAMDLYGKIVDKKGAGNEKEKAKAMRAVIGMFISLANKHALLSEANESFSSEDRFELYQEALAAFTELKDNRGMALGYSKIGEAGEEALESAPPEKVDEYQKLVSESYNKAAELYKQSHDAIGEAGAHIRLGQYYQTRPDQEKWRKAIDEFEKALNIYRGTDDRAGQIRAHKLLYEFYSKSSDPNDKREAIKALVQMNELYRSLENIRGQSDTYLKIGALHESLEQRKDAEAAFAEAQKFYKTSGDLKSEADVLSEVGEIYAAAKDKSGVELAVERLTLAAQIYLSTGSVETLAKTYDRLAEIHGQTPWKLAFSSDEATEWYQKAIEYYGIEADIYGSKSEAKAEPLKIAKIKRSIAFVYRDRLNDKAKALDYLKQSLELYEKGKSNTMGRIVKNEIAILTKQTGSQSPSKP
jgi:tetratricopeptide (TPR) repeat protein